MKKHVHRRRLGIAFAERFDVFVRLGVWGSERPVSVIRRAWSLRSHCLRCHFRFLSLFLFVRLSLFFFALCWFVVTGYFFYSFFYFFFLLLLLFFFRYDV